MSHSVDKTKMIVYTSRINMKKLIFTVLALVSLCAPVVVRAQETEIICPQPYGGGVVCGVHVPVETGIADNIALIGSLMLGSSGIFYYFSKRANRKNINQNN